jgi:hypothetical protein
MRLICLFFLTCVISSNVRGIGDFIEDRTQGDAGMQDTVKDNQLLFNGRDWRNQYYRIKGDQFLFSPEFLPGYLTISGKEFNNLLLRYDIYSDEIMIPTRHGSLLQLNKEMIDSFSIIFLDKTYHFIKIKNDSIKALNGYVNVLYNGRTSLFVKYKKEIELLAVDRKYDLFYQTHKIYIIKDSVISQVTGKGDIFNQLNKDEKTKIKSFITSNKLHLSKKNPESLIPVIRYYDSIRE